MNIPRDFEIVKTNKEKTLLQLYIDSVPSRPYATDTLGTLYKYPKDIALSYRYLQHNPPGSISTLIIDFDDPESHYKWDDLNAPPPNIAIMNPANGHCHLAYFIENKVYKNMPDNMGPYRFLSSIEIALIDKLGADPSYSNLISKNPSHDDWVAYYYQPYPYDLYWLADYLPKTKSIIKQPSLFVSGLGRNCTLFEELRHYAYSVIVSHSFGIDMDNLINNIYDRGLKLNKKYFDIPLDPKEVYGIAKSTGKWTFLNMSKNEFASIQLRRGKKSGVVRAKKASELYKKIRDIKLSDRLLSNREIASKFNIDEKTVRNALRYFEQKSNDNNIIQNQLDLF